MIRKLRQIVAELFRAWASGVREGAAVHAETAVMRDEEWRALQPGRRPNRSLAFELYELGIAWAELLEAIADSADPA